MSKTVFDKKEIPKEVREEINKANDELLAEEMKAEEWQGEEGSNDKN